MSGVLNKNIFSSSRVKKSYKVVKLKIRKIIDIIMISSIVCLSMINIHKNKIIRADKKTLEEVADSTKSIEASRKIITDSSKSLDACKNDINSFYIPRIRELEIKIKELQEHN